MRAGRYSLSAASFSRQGKVYGGSNSSVEVDAPVQFQNYDLGELNGGEMVVIKLSGTEANVQLVDNLNFPSYRARRRYQYVGGHYKWSPVRLQVPHSGHWHVVIDLGGDAGSVRSNVQVIRNPT